MPFWRRRREKLLHERLAEGTGLLDWRPKREPGPLMFKETLDVLHGGRQRQWDAVATASVIELSGDELEFTVLPDGTVLLDADLPEGALAPLADAVEQTLSPPYRAVAVRRNAQLWSVAANAIEVLELEQDVEGESISLSIQGGERTLLVDERPAWESIPELEAYGAARHPDFALLAERLDGRLWAVEVNPL